MASLEVAMKANPASVLPSLLIAGYLEHTALFSTTRTFRDQATLGNDASVRLSLRGGESIEDEAIIQYFAKIANSNASPEDALSVRTAHVESRSYLLMYTNRLKNGLKEAKAFSSMILSSSEGSWTT
jgi:hypothetical protein